MRFSQFTQELSFNCLSPQQLLDRKSHPDSELLPYINIMVIYEADEALNTL